MSSCTCDYEIVWKELWWKNTLYLKGELGLALRLSPHHDGDDDTDQHYDAEHRHWPGSQPSMNSNNAENKDQNTYGKNKTISRGNWFCSISISFLWALCSSHLVRWCRCWRRTLTCWTALCSKGRAHSWWWGDPLLVTVRQCSPRYKTQTYQGHPECWPSHRRYWAVQAGTFRWKTHGQNLT